MRSADGSDSASSDDGVERLHRADRIGAGRRLAGEHDGVGPFVDRVGRVADLGAGRAGARRASTRAPASRQSTGRPSARALRMICFCTRGNLLERHLEAEIAARDHHALRDVRIAGEVLHGRRALDLGDERRRARRLRPSRSLRPQHVVGRLHEAQARRDRRRARARSADRPRPSRSPPRRAARRPGALMPLCSPSEPPVTTTVVSSSGDRVDDPQLDAAVVEQQAIARLAERTQLGVRREDLPGARRRVARRRCAARLLRAGCRGRPPASGPVRIFGPLRSCMMATCRPARRDASRIAR